MTFILQPTENAAASQPFSIHPINWSPDADSNKTHLYDPQTNTTTVVNYPGSALLPRAARVVLCAGQGETLSTEAKVFIEFRTFQATDTLPEQWEVLKVLTPNDKQWTSMYPIESVRVRKEESIGETYGAMCFGIFGTTNQSQD